MTQTPTIVVFLPGTTGSNLVSADQPFDTLTPVWRTQIFQDLATSDVTAALNALEGTLYAGIPYGALSYNLPKLLQVGYGPVIHFFTSQHNFQYVNAQTSTPDTLASQWGLPSTLTGNLLIGFGYDWRADNATSAQSLRSLLSTIDQLYGPSYQVYLLAHSMGGLVSRAYLEAGSSSSDPWYGKIKALITLGTPHLGAPLALDAIVGNWLDFPSVPGGLKTMVHAFVDAQNSDSTYELLPPPSQKIISAGSSSYSIFDTDLPSSLQQLLQTDGLNTQDLAAALKFLQTLDYQDTSSLPPYYCVYGSFASDSSGQNLTCQSFQYANGQLTGIDSNEGDTIVPVSSAMFSGRTVAGLYEAPNVNHFHLPIDPGVQQQVIQWLGVS